ncbi:uncharacterized protein LOC122725032 [Manihot esculenta]|uniref:uncharacterized protein LOC122725032 n=1 Tax=Manihot esculenta TaxID=3983 RepID=UPI001CC7981B|nr:uncharacterized protein LOC122725032 [Manihot esculenta]
MAAAAAAEEQPLCITYPILNAPLELRTGMIHMLPKFQGLENEDPHRHLKEFYVVCSSMRPQGITDEQIRYKKLIASCPKHGITPKQLNLHFYEGLLPLERRIIDAASEGAIAEMEPEEGKTLISKLAANSRQYGREEDIPRNANEVSIASLDSKISQLTAAIQQLAAGNNTRTFGICKQAYHPTDMCPILQEGEQQVNAIRGFNGQQRKYDPFSSTYNSGWRDHPNLSYGNRKQNYQPRTNYQAAKSESQGKLPSQTIPNPKQNVSAITLRSGKELESASPKKLAQGSKADQKIEAEIEILEEKQPQKSEEEQSPMQVIRPPFPERFAQSKREKEEKEILEIFRKVQVNIPLLETIKQIPSIDVVDPLAQEAFELSKKTSWR